MSHISKYTLIAWLLIAYLSLLLWFRNLNLDRVFAPFLFCIGLLFLFLFAIYSGMNLYIAIRCIYLIIWLQIIVLCISLFIYKKNEFTGFLLIISSLIFIVSIFYIFSKMFTNKLIISNYNDILSTKNLLSYWWILYLVLLLLALVFLLYINSNKLGLIILIFYILLTSVYMYTYNYTIFNTQFIYLCSGFCFLVWMINFW